MAAAINLRTGIALLELFQTDAVDQWLGRAVPSRERRGYIDLHPVCTTSCCLGSKSFPTVATKPSSGVADGRLALFASTLVVQKGGIGTNTTEQVVERWSITFNSLPGFQCIHFAGIELFREFAPEHFEVVRITANTAVRRGKRLTRASFSFSLTLSLTLSL